MKFHSRFSMACGACAAATLLLATVASAKEPIAHRLSDADLALLESQSMFLAGGNELLTDFERPDWCPGFFCGPEFAACNSQGGTQTAVGDCGSTDTNRAGYWTSSANRHCEEPHVDTVNPFAGTQHLRWSPDPLFTSPCIANAYDGNIPTNCRQIIFSPVVPAPDAVSPATLRFEFQADTLGAPHMLAVARDAAREPSFFFYGLDGDTLRLNNGETNFPYDTSGTGYHTLAVNIDPALCTFRMFYDGIFIDELANCAFFAPQYVEVLETFDIRTDNGPGNLDMDNIQILRGQAAEPECGNGEVERQGGEECDSDLTDDPDCGGGACDQATCTCLCFDVGDFDCDDNLANVPELENGSTGPISGPLGGWWIYEADSPAVAFNTCSAPAGDANANDFDTFLVLWGLFGNSLGLLSYNDDCDTSSFGDFADPGASCFNRAGLQCDGGGNDGDACTDDDDCAIGSFCFGGGNEGAICLAECTDGVNDGMPCDTDDDCPDDMANPITGACEQDVQCQGFCLGNPNLPARTACTANAECEATVCTSGPVSLQGSSCDPSSAVCAEGENLGDPCTTDDDCLDDMMVPITGACSAASDCTAQVCASPACQNIGAACVDDNDCGGDAGSCRVVAGECNTIGACSEAGSCDLNATCDPAGIGSPFESCTCVGPGGSIPGLGTFSMVGVTILVDLDLAHGNVTAEEQVSFTIEKRRDCATPITTGMCCDIAEFACTDGLADSSTCTSPTAFFVEGKDCNPASCPLRAGACCDALGGTCVDEDPALNLPDTHVGVLEEDCTLGGVCNTVALDGSQQCQWFQGQSCEEITCGAATGACCDPSTPLKVGSCTDVEVSDCTGPNAEWFKGQACADIECNTDFVAIPTVSEWGLVVLTLLLLIGAKVYFGRRRVATA